ncbi:MAG: tetratricopeptide repeat protein, partial [Spartobacteria bacterium]|nr:tetratricopeptide repeat protein [Spartobacteria bacterium]
MRRHCCVICWMSLLASVFLSVCSGQTYQEGMDQYEMGNYREAMEIFSRLFKAEPDDEQINFALGMSALAAGKHSHALFAFERVLMQNPDNERARLELARTYYAMGRYETAQRYFEQALNGDPPEQVERNIDRYMDSIRLRLKRWEVSGDIAVSGFHDDNVNYGPSSTIIDSEIGELEVVSNSLPQKVYGGALFGRGEVSYDVGERRSWSALVDVNAYNNWLDDAREQEIMFYGGSARLRRAGPATLLDLPVRVDRLTYGHDPLVNIFGMNPALIWVVSPAWVSITRAVVEYRDYLDDSGRDGPYYRAGEMVKRYFGQGRHFISLQAQGYYDRANEPGF